MSVGKYSPTVSGWYAKDQSWHRKHTRAGDYDRDGYDSYGYNKRGKDRAGYSEDDYLLSGEWQGDNYVYPLYEDVWQDWYSKPCKSLK